MGKMIPLGDKLRDLRNERNLSQAQLAKRIGVTSSTIALYETGEQADTSERVGIFRVGEAPYALTLPSAPASRF